MSFCYFCFRYFHPVHIKTQQKVGKKKQAKMKQKLQKNFKLDEGFKNGLMVSARPTPNIF